MTGDDKEQDQPNFVFDGPFKFLTWLDVALTVLAILAGIAFWCMR